MKKTKKTNFKRIRFVLCTAILSAILSITFIIPNNSLALAKSDEYNYISEITNDSYIKSDDIYPENDISINNAGNNYTYSEPTEPLFLIKNVDGILNLLNDVAYITFQNHSFIIPNFDIYKIVNLEGNLRFYQADVSKDPSINTAYAFLSIYPDFESNQYTMYVQYGIEEERVLYNIRTPLTTEQLNFYAINEICQTFFSSFLKVFEIFFRKCQMHRKKHNEKAFKPLNYTFSEEKSQTYCLKAYDKSLHRRGGRFLSSCSSYAAFFRKRILNSLSFSSLNPFCL